MSEGVDLGADRESRAKPCAKRMDVRDQSGAPAVMWCVKDAGHDGSHACPRPAPLTGNTFAPTVKR